MKNTDALKALAALSQDSRLTVFKLLVRRGADGLAAGSIAEKLDLPNATLSFHLKELTLAGLIQARNEGRSVIYSANYETMNALITFLVENCCTDDPACGPACRVVLTSKRRK